MPHPTATSFHPNLLRGKFLVLDGGEGCGKTTQMRKLVSGLQHAGLTVCHVRDPGGTSAGERIRSLLLDPATGEIDMRCEMLLYMAARAQLIAEVIRPAMARGEVVVSDRFVSSTLAYQAGEHLTAGEIRRVAEVATGGTMPDLTLVLDVPTEIAMGRVTPEFVPLFDGAGVADPTRDRIEQRPVEYHKQVRQRYLAQAETDGTIIIDASADEETVTKRLASAINTHFRAAVEGAA